MDRLRFGTLPPCSDAETTTVGCPATVVIGFSENPETDREFAHGAAIIIATSVATITLTPPPTWSRSARYERVPGAASSH